MIQRSLKVLLLLILASTLMAFASPAHADPEEVIVAVIDTGADLLHTDIKNNLWVNSGEIPDNGIDDDANGLADDFHGWNFSHHNSDLKDQNGHGTHIAGIIAGLDGKREQHIKLMILKYYDASAPGMSNLLSSVEAIRYAIKMGAKIINYSGGGPFAVAEERQAVAEAEKAGVLFIAAAGNERSNSDIFHYYPADYPYSNILSVTAHDKDGKILPSSNFGASTVDTAALGKDVLSSLPGGRRGQMTGTSQATANASSLAARLLLARPDLKTPKEIIDLISLTGTYSDDLVGKTRFNSMLNFERAMQMHDMPIITQVTQIKSSLYTSSID